jgi:hypothetical protein
MLMALALTAALGGGATTAYGGVDQEGYGNARAVIEFQRAADAYAFLHRQAERRLGFPHARNEIGANDLAAAIIAARTQGSYPALFTPAVVAEFRSLAIHAVHRGCDAGELRTGMWEMSHDVHSPATGSKPIAGCIALVLPELPDELEYRSAGTVLLLVDHHANLVVDVLPALLAGSEIR